jgi:uncharacterized protein
MRKLLPLLLIAGPPTAAAQQSGSPIIDMHAHAYSVEFVAGASICPGSSSALIPTVDPRDDFDPVAELSRCAEPIAAPTSDHALMDESIAAMRRNNIRRAVTSGDPDMVAKWRSAAPGLIVPALGFGGSEHVSISTLEALAESGRLAVLGESFTQYRGVRADDPQWSDYWAFAEENDIPVGLHLGEGPPGAARFPGYGSYRASLTSPFQLEDILYSHPRLRLYVMHYASPLVDEMIAMMFAHPNLYVDISGNVGMAPRAQFYDHLKRMVDAGLIRRIMWGSDQMQWPGIIDESVRSIENAPFLTDEQRRDIFYNNAARFLRLSPEEIARDHRD